MALAKLFRGKLIDAVAKDWKAGELTCRDFADPDAFGRLKDALYKKNWGVYAKTPSGLSTHRRKLESGFVQRGR